MNKIKSVLHWLGGRWEKMLGVYWLLEPVRVSFIVAALAGVAFIFVDQGEDILCALGEGSSGVDFFWFFLGLASFCLSNWYWPRFLLNCDFPVRNSSVPVDEKLELCLRLHVPRALGIAPAGLLGVAFLWTAWGSPDWLRHVCLSAGCFLLAELLRRGFLARRKRLNQSLPGEKPRVIKGIHQHSGGKRYARFSDIREDRMACCGLVIFGVPAMLLFFAFLACPVFFGIHVGAAFVLFIAFASWSCYGAVFVYFGHRFRLPVLSLLMLLAFLSSFNNDNHAVRSLKSVPCSRANLPASLVEWRTRIIRDYPRESRHPLFIVATEGGGIRAGYWTALVLASLEDQAGEKYGSHCFSDHLFAISGVSGGSLGGAAFVGLLSQTNVTDHVHAVEEMLHQDFLAPLVGKMLFPDMVQRFLPYPCTGLDRARALEKGWEHNQSRQSRLNDFFTNGFTSFYAAAGSNHLHLPALFLNGTEMESGGRIITSSLIFTNAYGRFADAIDGVDKMDKEMRFSTAVHASARFTYFSPAGRFPDGTHVVDGGYFENSGGETARDILNTVLDQGWTDVQPVLIIIRNGVEQADQQANRHVLKYAGNEIYAPVDTLWNTRDAHATLARDELKNSVTSYPFDLFNQGAIVPLGWTLSAGAVKNMTGQLTNNLSSTTNILQLLAGSSRP